MNNKSISIGRSREHRAGEQRNRGTEGENGMCFGAEKSDQVPTCGGKEGGGDGERIRPDLIKERTQQEHAEGWNKGIISIDKHSSKRKTPRTETVRKSGSQWRDKNKEEDEEVTTERNGGRKAAAKTTTSGRRRRNHNSINSAMCVFRSFL